jgi:hypothetical protein
MEFSLVFFSVFQRVILIIWIKQEGSGQVSLSHLECD